MKKLLHTMILTLAVLLAGCDGNETNDAPVLRIIESDVTFKAAGGEGTIQIESTGHLTAISNAAWCTITTATNQTIAFRVDENYDYPGRSTQIVVSNETGVQKVTVTQQGAIIIFNEEDLERAVGNEQTSLTLALKASFPFKVSIPEEAQSWLSYQAVDEGIRFDFRENTTGAPRGARVTVSNGQRTALFVLMQYSADNLLGEWVASFNRYWQEMDETGKGPASITRTAANSYLISLPTSGLFPLLLKASYENNGFTIAAGQYQGETVVGSEDGQTSMTLYMYAGLSSAYYSYWTKEQSVSLAPSMTGGELVLMLRDNGSTQGDAVTDLLLGFFMKKDNLSQNTYVPSLTMDIYNLRLYR